MSTKKQFVELVNFLEGNKDKKVSALLEKIKEMTETKKMADTVIYKDDKPYAIFCYYHKQWELLSEVEYGVKKSHKSGFNTMCKIGTNLWTKQQANATKAKTQLIDDVSNGKVDPKDLKARMSEIEVNRTKILATNQPKGSKEAPTIK